MSDFVRTPDSNFADLPDFDFAPHDHMWQDVRIHFVDEGPRDGSRPFEVVARGHSENRLEENR